MLSFPESFSPWSEEASPDASATLLAASAAFSKAFNMRDREDLFSSGAWVPAADAGVFGASSHLPSLSSAVAPPRAPPGALTTSCMGRAHAVAGASHAEEAGPTRLAG